tara:strand:+ start:214 stop:699 length:486 start_codon:yes stop_codon:yes gene_type:complete
MKYESKTSRLIYILRKKNIKLCAAESITGGRFAFEIIKNEDASKIFNFSLVTYTNESKSKILGLKKKINKTNVVSREMSKYMVSEVIKFSNPRETLAISCTGQAGPKILNTNYPVGTVFIGVAYKEKIFSFKKCFDLKDRKSIIESTVKEMIKICLNIVKN